MKVIRYQSTAGIETSQHVMWGWDENSESENYIKDETIAHLYENFSDPDNWNLKNGYVFCEEYTPGIFDEETGHPQAAAEDVIVIAEVEHVYRPAGIGHGIVVNMHEAQSIVYIKNN